MQHQLLWASPVWAPVSNFNKFTAIENDAPGFQLFPLLWEETSCYFFGGNRLFCTFVQLYQMLHNSGLQLPQCSGCFSGFMFNVSLHAIKWKIVFSVMPTGGLIRVDIATAIFPLCNQNYWSFTCEWSTTVSLIGESNADESITLWSPTTALKPPVQFSTGHSPSSTSMITSRSIKVRVFCVFVQSRATFFGINHPDP